MRLYTASMFALVLLMFGAREVNAAGQAAPRISPLTATLVVPDSTLLPGVPFDMWVTVSNPSDASVGLGLCADLLVKPERSEPYTVRFGGERGRYPTLLPERTWSDGRETYIVLRPHEAKTLTVPVEPGLEGPAYFRDARLSPPGKYEIALQLGYCWGMATPQTALLPPEFLGPVTTNEVVITRIEPTGDDAKVWKRMQELTHGNWVPAQWEVSPAGQTVANEVEANYRDSNYFPYVTAATMIGSASESNIARFLDTIERFPNSPIIDLVHIAARAVLAGNCGLKTERAKLCERETDYLAHSTKPTTRIIAFGREDLPKDACPPEIECDN
ncbi:MAG TPA: hypothetical protein VGR95_04655 [Thermoanaerobaculia bacterium]|nr:hypothetical protein [Thermoanaerobaculia bacterium]